jgi:carbamoyl-phosphate synthase large subunit
VTTVLFTCAGQRVDIVSAFARAGATTVAGDLDRLAPALYHADRRVLLPPVRDGSYVEAVAAAVAEHDVDLIVPVTDIDLHRIVPERDRLGAMLLISPTSVVEAVSDKYLAHLLLEERGLDSPPTWLQTELPAEPPYPVLVKARGGFGSRHIYRAENREQLDFFLRYTPEPRSIVQACLPGEEFSIDVFCDFEGRCINAIPRTMIQSKGGESIKGMTIKDPELIDVGRRVAEALPIWGPANVQCFRQADGTYPVTDVNPRYPELALALARGERLEPSVGQFREGVFMTRFFSDLCLVRGPEGALEPFAEELPEPLAHEPGE